MNGCSRRGYTLLEMVMVLGIIAICGLAITPRVSRIVNAWNLDTEINKVKTKIRQAQQLAIAEQTDYRVTWDLVGNNYTIYKYNGAAWTIVEQLYYSNNVRATSTTWSLPFMNTLQFDQFGAPYANVGGSIFFQHTITGQSKRITVDNYTGRLWVY